MTYHLDRGLFVENGATILAERDRTARAASIAYQLVGTRPASPTPAGKADLHAAA